jgi:hypothetical protein
LHGTLAAPALLDAATNSAGITFTADIATGGITRITHFNANDSIAITGGGSHDLIVANNGADVVLTVNASGIVTQITLVGVTSPSATIGSLAAFNALGIGKVTYQ